MTDTSQSGTIVAAAQNPMVLFSVYAGILAASAAVISRSQALEPDPERIRSQRPSLVQYYRLIERARRLQNGHHNLILQTDTGNKALYPIGVETMWLAASQQAETYRNVRDQSLELYARVIQHTLQAPRLHALARYRKALPKVLFALQISAYNSLHAVTFNDSATSLGEGLATLTALFALTLR